jgi:hypothetical protein
MSDYSVGDIVQLNNTEQQGDVLEVIHVHTGEPGPLLRVQLHADTGARKARAGKAALPEVAYWGAHAVLLVKSAAEAAPKHDRAEHEKKPEHGVTKK